MACRIAVIGAGPLVGRSHCKIISDLPGVELACICQRRHDDAEVAASFGVRLYTDAFTMTCEEGLDGVVIAAPTHFHLPLVKSCIAGAQKRQADLGSPCLRLRALLVEKPLAENLAAAQALVSCAHEAGVEVLCGHQRRHSAFVERARSLVTDANFGPLRGVTVEFSLLKPEGYFRKDNPKLEWRGQKGKGGPLLINMIHDIDLLRYITGHEIVNVFAATSSSARDNEVEDTGAVTITFDHGAVGTLFFSDAAPSPWSYEFTTGENKKYPPVPGEAQRDCYHFMGAQRSLGFPSLRGYTYGPEVAEKGWDAPMTFEENHVDRVDPLFMQMAHFVQVCLGNETPICSGGDAIMSLAVVTAAIHSAEIHAPVMPDKLLTQMSQRPTSDHALEEEKLAGQLTVSDRPFAKAKSSCESTKAGASRIDMEESVCESTLAGGTRSAWDQCSQE